MTECKLILRQRVKHTGLGSQRPKLTKLVFDRFLRVHLKKLTPQGDVVQTKVYERDIFSG